MLEVGEEGVLGRYLGVGEGGIFYSFGGGLVWFLFRGAGLLEVYEEDVFDFL